MSEATHLEPPLNRYGGMNPEFVKAVWNKRREMERGEAQRRLAEHRRARSQMKKIVASYSSRQIIEPSTTISAEKIIKEGAIASGFSVDDIKGERRFIPLVRVRQALYAQVYLECPHLSLPHIGMKFGGRDHTTILHALKKLGVYGKRHSSSKAA